MQQLMAMTHNQTMTSKELVEAINAIRKEEGNDVVIQHKDMLVKIRNLSSVLGQRSVTPDKYLSSIGQEQPMFLLDKRASLLLVSAESARVNLAIIDRWQELEEVQQKALPQTHIQAVEAYLETLKTVELQKVTLVQQMGVIEDKKVITNEGEEYHSVKRIREMNPTAVIGGRKLATSSAKLNIPPKALFTHYDINNPMVWHISVWVDAYPELEYPE